MMTESCETLAALALGVLFFVVLGGGAAVAGKNRLPQAERLLRHRILGAVLMLLALAWCIPQIRAVAWNFLAPWLWPLAIAATVASYFYLDNVVSRAIGGLLIMGAYTFLAFSFTTRLPTGVYGACIAWFWGIVGILISAKPCWLRDFLRLGARRPLWRMLAAGLAGLTACFGVAVMILYWRSLA